MKIIIVSTIVAGLCVTSAAAQRQLGPCKVLEAENIASTSYHFDSSQGYPWGDSILVIFELSELEKLEELNRWAKANDFLLYHRSIASYMHDDKRAALLVTLAQKVKTNDLERIRSSFTAVKEVKRELGIDDCGLAIAKMRSDHPAHKRYKEAPCPDGGESK
jgi:hypothetical protein